MAPPEAAALQGRYEMGFQITPLVDGQLDTSGDFKGGPHPAEEDPLYKMAVENRDGGNKMVKQGRHEEAIGRYSEMIMQTRALDNEINIEWTDEGHDAVRQLRAAAYLNLSLCFLKTEQWTHASNTATRALQGDKDPADPKDDVLTPEKKAKALFRRAQAQSQGFGNYAKALEDLKAALVHTPSDKAIEQEASRLERLLTKASKAADKKLAGFLTSNKKVKDGEGLFTEELRPTPKPAPKLTEPVKMSDGLWVVPGMEDKPKVEPSEENLDVEELSREINEMKEDNPGEYEALREKIHKKLEEEVAELERKEKEEADKEGEDKTGKEDVEASAETPLKAGEAEKDDAEAAVGA